MDCEKTTVVPKILVVDDQPEILEVAVEVFTEYINAEMTTASDAMSAIELCQKNKFDLILTDQMMPGMLGIDFIKLIRELDGPNKETQIYMVSANTNIIENEVLTIDKVKCFHKSDSFDGMLKTIEKDFAINLKLE